MLIFRAVFGLFILSLGLRPGSPFNSLSATKRATSWSKSKVSHDIGNKVLGRDRRVGLGESKGFSASSPHLADSGSGTAQKGPDGPDKKNKLTLLVDSFGRRMKILGLSFILMLLSLESLADKVKLSLYERLSRKKTPLNAILLRFVSIFFQRKTYSRLMAFFFLSYAVKSYLLYKKSLITEVAYSTFLKLVTDHPEKVQRVCVNAGEIAFAVDGLQAVTRLVTLEPSLLKRLMDSGIEFYAPKPGANVLGFVWSALYLGFLYNMAMKMSGGPQDKGAGKRSNQRFILFHHNLLFFRLLLSNLILCFLLL